MATRPSTTIAISQMIPIETVHPDMVMPVVFGNKNYKIKISSITSSITKESLGLGKVENLAPSEMPVSQAQQEALNGKLGRDEMISQSQVINLTQDLEMKLGKNDNIPQSQVIGLTQDIYMLQNGPISVTRVDGFDLAVQQIINSQPIPEDQVIQGKHSW